MAHALCESIFLPGLYCCGGGLVLVYCLSCMCMIGGGPVSVGRGACRGHRTASYVSPCLLPFFMTGSLSVCWPASIWDALSLLILKH